MAVVDAATSMKKAMPNVLLFRDVNDMDDRTDYIFHYITNELLQNHIVVTNNFEDVTWVHMTIVFLNANFVKTHSSYLKRFVEEVKRRNMLLTAVVYENYDCVKLVSNTFRVFKDKFPCDFDFCSEDPAEKEEMTKLVVKFFGAMLINYCNIPFSKDKTSIQVTLKRLTSKVITYLNPYNIDYTGVPLNILSELVQMCDEVDHRRKPFYPYPYFEPLLVLLEFEQCEHDSCILDKTSILQFIYSLNKIRNRDFYLYLNILVPPPDANGKRPSFSSVFYETIKTQTAHGGCFDMLPTFIIVDDFASFLEDGEDPVEMLADLVREFGQGSVIITTCSYPINIRMDIGSNVQSFQGICALPNTRLKWNSIFATFFNELVFSNSHTDVVGTEDEEDDTEEVLRRRKIIQRPLKSSGAPKRSLNKLHV